MIVLVDEITKVKKLFRVTRNDRLNDRNKSRLVGIARIDDQVLVDSGCWFECEVCVPH